VLVPERLALAHHAVLAGRGLVVGFDDGRRARAGTRPGVTKRTCSLRAHRLQGMTRGCSNERVSSRCWRRSSPAFGPVTALWR
jgi:hypothetical protein